MGQKEEFATQSRRCLKLPQYRKSDEDSTPRECLPLPPTLFGISSLQEGKKMYPVVVTHFGGLTYGSSGN